MAKLVFDFQGAPRIASANNNVSVMAIAIKATPGVGNPFLYYSNIPVPPGEVLATVDYDLHPDWAGLGNVVRATTAENVAMLNAMLAAPPLDALTFAPPE